MWFSMRALLVVLQVSCAASVTDGRYGRHADGDLPQVIRLIPYEAGLRTINVQIAGRGYTFLFDTGGGVTVVTPATAASVGCNPAGRLIVHRMSGERVELARCPEMPIQLGPVTVSEEIAVMDINALLPPTWPPLAGLLSLSALEVIPFTVDLSAGTLTLESQRSLRERARAMESVDVRIARPGGGAGLDVFVAVDGGGSVPLWMELDSGNVAGVVIANHARALQLDENTVRVSVGTSSLDLPGYSADIIYDGNLGAGFMEHFVMTFDLSAGSAWLRAIER